MSGAAFELAEELAALEALTARLQAKSREDPLEYLVNTVRRYEYFESQSEDRRAYYRAVHRMHRKVLDLFRSRGDYLGFLSSERHSVRRELDRVTRGGGPPPRHPHHNGGPKRARDSPPPSHNGKRPRDEAGPSSSWRRPPDDARATAHHHPVSCT
ncbi:Aste57867_19997 [Aphanomyces stellatus]|uniref:Aste57867_19997 protein n=1 Tax=Aphanomyces stellatus TaxID=120398 RepID=A0A485LEM7_9STRA|nr:hypothetical protein As57867_019931 [Aphanomyces stellatus]VFT96694.1 Aste57867_19997 [Aphanomyces stellatus]